MKIERLGKRIAVVGVSASGKSTFARRLAAKTNLPLTHIDAVMWKPGWDYIGDEETVRRLKETSQQEEWIIEGFIDKNALEAVLIRAESIIYLDYPRHIAAWRYIKRWLKHRKNPRPELEGSPEKFSFEFLKRVWDKKEVYRLNKFLKTMPDTDKVMKLTSPGNAEFFLRV
jgi:adenylate kinase family enzyme